MSELPPALASIRVQALGAIEQGNERRAQGATELALAAYDEAVTLLTPYCAGEHLFLRDDAGSAWTNRGIALMDLNAPERLDAILAAFDKAAELRGPLATQENPWFRYNLVGVWLNRGDALQRLGGPARAAEALAAYDEALRLSEGLKSGIHPDFNRRVALARLNWAAATAILPTESRLDEAAASYRAAADMLSLLGPEKTPLDQAMTASAWVGHSEVEQRAGRWDWALESTLRALAFVKGLEEEHRRAALAGLRARWLLCALAGSAMARDPGAESSVRTASTATDAAEEGLRVALRWDGDGSFQPFVLEYYRFCLQSYGWRQPQFLAEFIDEFLPLVKPGSAAEARRMAAKAVASTLQRIADQGQESVRAADAEKTLVLFRELRSLQVRLASPAT